MELNFCTQFERFVNRPIIWFGLTQAQEAQAGFDACTRLGAKLLIFQFKASSYVLRNGARQFVAEHEQMQALRARCAQGRSLFYVFPMVGTTLELTNNPDLIGNTWLLDVADLPNSIPAPTKRGGTPRKNKIHYIDVYDVGFARIHSDPFDTRLINASVFAGEELPDLTGRAGLFGDNFDRFHAFSKFLLRTSKAAAILP
ncbi:MAG TPA: hypothetical protein VJT71_02285 [Pyrinomonadaceae bacterium]|nr:hypothetical protein [Pyrinomonadaceae bacterium]